MAFIFSYFNPSLCRLTALLNLFAGVPVHLYKNGLNKNASLFIARCTCWKSFAFFSQHIILLKHMEEEEKNPLDNRVNE